MDDCFNADTRKVGNCRFSICKEQAAGDCKLCRTNLILNIDGCSCEEFESEYEASFFIRGNTGQSNENFKGSCFPHVNHFRRTLLYDSKVILG